MITVFRDFLQLFFPRYCLACQQQVLTPSEVLLCTSCAYTLPQANVHNAQDRDIMHKLYSQLPISHACAMYRLRKGGGVQRLVYALKYGNKPQVGLFLGKKYGTVLRSVPWHQDWDLIVPVPLHSARLRQRGYNQSSLFAQGLSTVLEVPWSDDCLRRTRNTKTQTKKSRLERLCNVEGAFCVTNPERVAGQHVLLVDDVVTTGATLSACAATLVAHGVRAVSIAALAVADS